MAFELNRDLPSGVSGNYWRISSALVACNTDNPVCDVYMELFLTRQARIDGKAALLVESDSIPLTSIDMSFSFDFRACLYNTLKSFPKWSSAVDIFDDPNLIPVASPINITTTFDTAKTFTIPAYDNFNKPLTYTIVQPMNGVISVTNGVYTYTPNSGFYGTDTGSYVASNGEYDSESKTITIVVDDTPDRPVAFGNNMIVGSEISGNVNLLGSDPNDVALTYNITSQPSNGIVTVSNNVATYTSNTGFSGNDQFEFVVSNGTYQSEPAIITVTVIFVVPVTDDISANTVVNQSVDITALGNDPQGQPLTYSVVSSPANGSVTIVDNILQYTPATDFTGTDSFTYKANNGTYDSNISTVSINIGAV